MQLCWVEKQEPAFVFVFLMMESSVLDVGDTAVFTVVQTAQEPSIKYYGRLLGGRPLSRQREAVVIMDRLYGWSKTTSTQPGSPPDCKAVEACEASQKSSECFQSFSLFPCIEHGCESTCTSSMKSGTTSWCKAMLQSNWGDDNTLILVAAI